MYKIYVVLLNYNGYNDTKECIESILKGQNNMYFNINICVVDNDSTQEERKLLFNLKNKIKNLDIIFNNTNEGYAKGNNIGISFAIKNQADYIWVLNNDVTVEENAVNELIKSAKNSEAFFSTKIYDYYYRNELQYFGADIVGKSLIFILIKLMVKLIEIQTLYQVHQFLHIEIYGKNINYRKNISYMKKILISAYI